MQHAKPPTAEVRKIVHLRGEQRLGPVLIAAKLGIPALTVHAVLVWCRLNRRRLAFAPIGPPRGAHST